MNKRLLGAAVLGTSLLVALVAAEAGLRLISKYWLSVYDVEMWRYARQIKTLSSYPGVVEEHGFRLPDPATQARRRPGNRLAVALGDSLTFGWGVPEGQTFPDQLERLL